MLKEEDKRKIEKMGAREVIDRSFALLITGKISKKTYMDILKYHQSFLENGGRQKLV